MNTTLQIISKEERANTLTHMAGILFTLIVGARLIPLALQHSVSMTIGMILFVIGMTFMYTSSTIYHLALPGRHKQYLRVLDHSSIYLMIAGSYSPICLGVLGGKIGIGVFCFLWLCTIVGIVSKVVALGKNPGLSLALYIAMGWTALLIIHPLWHALSHEAFFAIILEGIYYTAGAHFFRHDEEFPYYHAIWHVFILIGSFCHTIAMFQLF